MVVVEPPLYPHLQWLAVQGDEGDRMANAGGTLGEGTEQLLSTLVLSRDPGYPTCLRTRLSLSDHTQPVAGWMGGALYSHSHGYHGF